MTKKVLENGQLWQKGEFKGGLQMILFGRFLYF